MSILRHKRFALADGGVLRDSGGGGGGSQPTQSTSYNTNIPEYAKPYVENMLQSTQAQIYNDDMTSFRPYTPYSTDASKYFAEFTPEQRYAQSETANMQTPGQYGAASMMAGMAGMGGLGAAGQADYLGNQALGYGQAGQTYGDVGQMYGAQGAQNAQSAAQMAQMQAQRFGQQAVRTGQQSLGYGAQGSQYGQGAVDIGQGAAQMAAQQGLGYGALGTGYGAQAAQQAQQGYSAGDRYAQQATNPNATAAYMSPYMQNVVDYQKSQALRDFQMGQGMRQASAVSKGAFGGSRQAIENAEAQRNLNSQLQGIEATGAQEAFKNAQGQQQFGANLGLQGLQAGYQGTGMGIQGAQTGLQGLQGALAGSAQGLQGYQTGLQGAQTGMQGVQGALAGYNTGLSGVGQQLGAGQLGLAGTAQGMQGAQAGMQGAGMGLQGVQGALGAGQYGLQGYGLANTAAGQLATIGGQQQSSDLARINAQNTMGAQQQAYKQNLINQDISNYATAQQYPFMQLGIMNSMLRGLPLQQTTTASYQQQPSTTQQLTGLAGAGLSYLGGGRKAGGVIKMKEGGSVPGFKYGDLISDPQLQGMSQSLSPQQLQGRIADPQVNNNERDIFQSTQQAQQRMASNPMAAQQMAQAAPPPQMAQAPSDAARMSGIAQAGGDMFNTMGYAGGGIIAFAQGDLIEEQRLQAEKDAAAQDAAIAAKEKKAPIKTAAKDTKTITKEAGPSSREDYQAQTQAMMEKQGFKPGATADEQAYADMVARQQAGLGDATSAKERANMAKAFLKMGSNARGFLPGAIEGAESYLTGAGEIAAGKETKEMALAEARAKYAAGQRARAAGDITASDKLFDEAKKLESQANIAKNRDATSIRTAEISAGAAGQASRQEEAKVDAYMRDNPGVTRSQAYAAVAQYSRGETNEINRMRYADMILNDDTEYQKYKNSKKPEDQAKAAEIKRATYQRYGVTQSAAAPTGPVPAEVKVGGNTYNRKDYPQMTDQQWADYVRQNKG